MRAALDRAARRRILTEIWTVIERSHWDPAMVGARWRAAYRKWEPRALAAPDDERFWAAAQGMVSELGQSHFAVIPPAAYARSQGVASEGSASTGASLVFAEGRVLVGSVRPGSPAEAAPVRPGWEVSSIGGKSLLETLKPLLARKARPVELALALRALASGEAGRSRPWVVRDENGASHTRPIRYEPLPGTIVEQLGLPPVTVFTESRRLEGGVGYLRFNIFLLPNLEKLREAAQELGDASGIILDLRGNPGGLLPMTWGVAGMFCNRPGNLGVMRQRNATLTFPVNPQEPKFGGPLAVLTDELSLSCSEVLAGGLQEMGRAKIIGRRTGGMVLPAQIRRLPGGGRLEHAIADFKTPKGIYLEGRGVIPDIPVTLTRKLLLSDPDPDITAALKWIANQNRGKS